jgi:hypothetical protein
VTGPAAIELTLAPVPGRPSYYTAKDVAGRVVVRASRQPLLDAARALARVGMPPEAIVTARHRGSGIVAMRATIGEAAKWRLEESDRGGLKRRPWRPFDPAQVSAHGVVENEQPATPMDDRSSAPARPAIAAIARPQSGTFRAGSDARHHGP